MKIQLFFQCLFLQIRKHLQQCGCEIKMKIDFIKNNFFYNVIFKLEHQSAEYDSPSEVSIAVQMGVRETFLKSRGNAQMFCSAIQFLFWTEASFDFAESVNFNTRTVPSGSVKR